MNIFVVGGSVAYARPFLQMLDASLVDDPEQADVLWFTGGEDVDPAIYNQPEHPRTHYNVRRSYQEDQLIKLYPEKFKVGTCRGHQQFHASLGGVLIQHTDRHAGSNHVVKDTNTGEMFEVNSAHHQAVLRTAHVNMEVLLVTPEPIASIQQLGANNEQGFESIEVVEEIEAAYWPEINAFGVQWHPEWMYGGGRAVPWFIETLMRLYAQHQQK